MVLLLQECTCHGFIIAGVYMSWFYYCRSVHIMVLLLQECTVHGFIIAGVYSSSDDSDMEEELPWQRTWFTVSSDDDNSDDDE